MSDFSEIVNSTVDLFSNNLVVGNHDSITLFGIQPQNDLKDYSKRVTGLMIKQTEELDLAVSDVIQEIACFEKSVKGPHKSFIGRRRNTREIIKEYNKIISYIENITLYFKMQQTQLVKEIKLFEKYLKNMESCSSDLMQYIEIGKAVLSEKKTAGVKERDLLIPQNCSEDELWYYRLEKRIEDLSISYTLSLQNIAQIEMLHKNNLLMFDKISSAISNTFPIWQSQMSILLGIEMLGTRLEVQDKITKSNKLGKKDKNFDIDRIVDINSDLSNALNEMFKLEQNNDGIRKEFLRIQ